MQLTYLLVVLFAVTLGFVKMAECSVTCGGAPCSTKCVACLDSAGKPVTKCDKCPTGFKPNFGGQCEAGKCTQCVFCVDQKTKQGYKACDACPSGVGVAYDSQQ